MTIRLATPQDEEALYDLLVTLWKNNDCGWGFPYRPEIVLAVIEQGTRPDPATRRNPRDQRRGLIGVIEDPETPGRLIGSAGLFLDAPMWFTDAVVPTELWMFVRPEARGRRHYERELASWTEKIRDDLRAGMPESYPLPWPLQTGFMHQGEHYAGMERLWRMLFRRARKVGTLFWVD